MCWFEMTLRCMCEDDRLRNAEEELVGMRSSEWVFSADGVGTEEITQGDRRERLVAHTWP